MDIKTARLILSKLAGSSDSVEAVEACVTIFKVLDEEVQKPSHNNQSKYAEQICSQCVVVASCSIRKNNPKIIGCAYIYE